MSNYRTGVDRQASTTTGGSYDTPPGHIITDWRDHARARAWLKGIGFTGADLACPIIGVANTWIEAMPCNNTSYKKSTYMIKDTSMSESIGCVERCPPMSLGVHPTLMESFSCSPRIANDRSFSWGLLSNLLSTHCIVNRE